jgi:hypothetical protein
MAQRRSDTEPGPALAPVASGPEPEPAPPSHAGYRYERPAIDDPDVHKLLDGLNAPRFPRAVDVRETDGELAAQYSAGPHGAPARTRTPTPQPAVLFSRTARLPAAGAPSMPPPVRRSNEEAVVVAAKRRVRTAAVLAAVCLVVGAGVIVALVRARSATTEQVTPGEPRAATTARGPVSPAPPVSSPLPVPAAMVPTEAAATSATPAPHASSRPAARPRHHGPAAAASQAAPVPSPKLDDEL